MEKNGVLFAHVPEPIFSYGGRAGWRMMGWVAVIACYRTSATLLAHVPEPIVLLGGSAGWRLMGWVAVDQRHIARTRTGANSISWRKGGVEKNGVLLAHVPEPVQCMVKGRGGKERCSFRTRTGTILVCMVDERGGKD